MARDTQDTAGGRHRRGRKARGSSEVEELVTPLPGGLPPRAPWRRGKDDDSFTPIPKGSTARPLGATPVPGLVPGAFVRPLPKSTGSTDVLTLAAPPTLDPLGRLECPSPVATDDLVDPLAEARRRSAAVVAGVVTGAVTLPPMLGMNPAGAAINPVPNPTPAVTLPSGIEDFAPYVGQNSCDPHAKPGVVAFSQLVLSYWGHGGSYGITRACNIGGESEHKEGRAWDFKLDPNDYGDQVVGQRVVDWLLADDAVNARRLGIMYIIWNERIWSTYQREDGWRPYSGPDNHTSHIHFSFSWAGAMKRTSWWTGVVAPTEFGPCQKYIGTAVPVYGNTINLSPCPKPKAKPKPKPADDKNDKPKNDDKGKDDKPNATVVIYKTVVVKRGQTLLGIAHRNHVSVSRIMKINHLKNRSAIHVGQKLRMPARGKNADSHKPVSATKVKTPEHNVRIVTVKSGDTLGALALKYHTTVAAMVKANKLKSADHIYPGQKLRIP